jgi:long-chain acyl-CoA synthetase
VESTYKTSAFVQNIVVYADPEQAYCVAIIQPVEKEIQRVAKISNLFPNPESMELASMAEHPEVVKAVHNSLKDVAKKAGLKPAEIVGAVYVAGEEWTPQNGLLTAAMKLKRKELLAHYAAQIKKMYNPSK